MKEIKRALIEANIKNIGKLNQKKIKELFNKTTGSNIQKENFVKAQEYAQSKGGKCLSKSYINTKTKMDWKCNNKNHPTWLSPLKKL